MSDQTRPKNKPNTGALFKNQKKSENSPDYTGVLTLENGRDVRVSGWVKQSRNGVSYMSLALSELKQKSQPGTATSFL